MSDEKQLAMMAADVAQRAAFAIAGGDTYLEGLTCARDILEGKNAEAVYRFALGCYGAASEQIDAAVASIQRGEWPANSLAGQVEAMRKVAMKELRLRVKNGGGPGADQAQGHVEGIDAVLDLLGVKP